MRCCSSGRGLRRHSRGRHGSTGLGGATVLRVVAPAVGTEEEGNIGEGLAAHQGSKREKKYMGSRRGARQS